MRRPKCHGHCGKRIPTIRHNAGLRFCSNKCAAGWAQTMTAGESWCESHGWYENESPCCTTTEV